MEEVVPRSKELNDVLLGFPVRYKLDNCEQKRPNLRLQNSWKHFNFKVIWEWMRCDVTRTPTVQEGEDHSLWDRLLLPTHAFLSSFFKNNTSISRTTCFTQSNLKKNMLIFHLWILDTCLFQSFSSIHMTTRKDPFERESSHCHRSSSDQNCIVTFNNNANTNSHLLVCFCKFGSEETSEIWDPKLSQSKIKRVS